MLLNVYCIASNKIYEIQLKSNIFWLLKLKREKNNHYDQIITGIVNYHRWPKKIMYLNLVIEFSNSEDII